MLPNAFSRSFNTQRFSIMKKYLIKLTLLKWARKIDEKFYLILEQFHSRVPSDSVFSRNLCLSCIVTNLTFPIALHLVLHLKLLVYFHPLDSLPLSLARHQNRESLCACRDREKKQKKEKKRKWNKMKITQRKEEKLMRKSFSAWDILL